MAPIQAPFRQAGVPHRAPASAPTAPYRVYSMNPGAPDGKSAQSPAPSAPPITPPFRSPRTNRIRSLSKPARESANHNGPPPELSLSRRCGPTSGAASGHGGLVRIPDTRFHQARVPQVVQGAGDLSRYVGRQRRAHLLGP